VITTTGNTLIRIAASTTTSLGAVTGYTGLTGMDDGLVTEMAFTGTAAQLSAALKTLEAKSADGLGKVAVHIVPHNLGVNSVSVRVDSVTGSISYYKRVATSLNASNAQIAAKSIANQIVTPDGSLTGYLSNVTSAAETTFLQQKGVVGSNSWIGLSDVAVEGQWRWLDGPEAGSLSTYFLWNRNEPNNSGNEDYVHLRSDYFWNDDKAGTLFPYVVEYSAAANSTLLRRELSPSKGIISITDPNIATALNNATFSGTVSGYTTSLNGSQLTFTSTQPLTNVPNISYSFTTAADPPSVFAAPVINEGGSSLATALLEFPAGGLQTGDTITVSGLTFTASRATSATELATAFASLIDSATTGAGTSYGSYSGSLTGFTSGPLVSTNRVLFTQVDSGVANSIASTAIITTTATTLVAATITGTGLTVDKFTTAQDALFTVDDKSYTKTTNTVGDVISGLTLQLTGDAGIANVSVVLGEDKSEVSIKSFMTAYNDLIKSANAMNANSSNSEKPGTFANSPTSLSFISDIKRKVADGATYNIGKTDSTGRPYTMSLSSLGLDYQLDGTLSYSATSLASAKSQGLRDKLLSGLRIGYSSSTDNLADLLTSQMSSIGVLTNQTSSGAESLSSLNKEKDRLEERLNKIQAGYIAQYSNLNKLLFQLNSTSQSLTSALDGLKNA
jgi:flagellar capping protein FliD